MLVEGETATVGGGHCAKTGPANHVKKARIGKEPEKALGVKLFMRIIK
jgi:hypothetical protein